MDSQNNGYHPRIVIGGLIAINVVIMQSLIGLDKADILQEIALTAFAIAIPVLSFAFFILIYPKKRANRGTQAYNISLVVGVPSTIIGIGSAFWHASHVSGIAFIVSIFYILIMLSYVSLPLK